MTSMTAQSLPQQSSERRTLVQRLARSVLRGRLLATLGIVLLMCAVLGIGLFALAVTDAVSPLAETPRLAVLLTLLVLTFAAGLYFIARRWRANTAELSAAEQTDRAGNAQDHPVLRGLSLMATTNKDDPLARSLQQRAEKQAADLAEMVPTKSVYPLRLLGWQSSCLGLACLAWLALAVIFPSQFQGLFARAAMPWSPTPPFSLTQLEPTWKPAPPEAGDDVTVSVIPEGRMPEQVDLIRLDKSGDEAERFAMVADGQGGFHHTLRRLESPVTFTLEAASRPTRPYTITPNPRPPEPETKEPEAQDEPSPPAGGGSTDYDPDAVAKRDTAAHPNAEALRDKIEQLLKDLAEAKANAQTADPSDLEGLIKLADQIAELTKSADGLADELSTMQAELPPDAAAALADLQAALSSMQSGQLPAAPGSSDASDPASTSGTNTDPSSGEPTETQSPTPADWLNQASEALGEDEGRLGQGLGQSSLPTESGSASGTPDGKIPPDFKDPGATGTYDQTGTSSDVGPLPDAVMQQVPPSYRPFVKAYFSQLAKPDTTEDAP